MGLEKVNKKGISLFQEKRVELFESIRRKMHRHFSINRQKTTDSSRGGGIRNDLGEETEKGEGKLREKGRRRANKVNEGSVEFLEGDEIIVGGKRGKEELLEKVMGGEDRSQEGESRVCSNEGIRERGGGRTRRGTR